MTPSSPNDRRAARGQLLRHLAAKKRMVWQDATSKPKRRPYVRGKRNTSYGEMLVYTIPQWVSLPEPRSEPLLQAELPSAVKTAIAMAAKWEEAMKLPIIATSKLHRAKAR